MIGSLLRLIGKPLINIVGKNLIKLMKFTGKSILGGILGKNLAGRLIGGILGKVLGTGLFGGLTSLLGGLIKLTGLNDNQIVPELSQAITKEKIRYYEKQVREFVPKKGRPKIGELNNEQRLEKLNYNLDQAKRELTLKETSNKEKKFDKNSLLDGIGTILGVLSVVPNLITTSVTSLFSSKSNNDNIENDSDNVATLESDLEVNDKVEPTDSNESDNNIKESSIGKNIGGIAGGLLGSIFGGPLLGGTIGYFAGNTLGGYIDKFIDKKRNSKVINTNEITPTIKSKNDSIKLNNDSIVLKQSSEYNNKNIVNKQLNQSFSIEQDPLRLIERPNVVKDTINAMDKIDSLHDNMNNNINNDIDNESDPIIINNTIIQPIKEKVIIQNSSILDKYKTSKG